MYKKIIATACISLAILSQTVIATNEDIMTQNVSAKDTFYQTHGYDSYADVFYNGEYMEFPDAQPMVINGTTFVPIRTFSETLGAEVTYDDVTTEVGIINGDDKITFIVGSADITTNGEVSTLTSSTFLIEGRTMVPARLISEAFDLEVSWNGTYQQVSIMDINALKEGMDTDFTVLDSVISMYNSQPYEGNIKTEGEFKMTYGGADMNLSGGMDFSSITKADMSAMDFEMNINLEDQTVAMLKLLLGAYDEDVEDLNLMLDRLSDMNISLVADLANEEFYASSNVTDLISTYAFGVSLPNETAFKLALADVLSEAEVASFKAELAQYQEMSEKYAELEISTIIDLILEQTLTANLYDGNTYQIISDVLAQLSDDNFIKDGNDYTLLGSTTGEIDGYISATVFTWEVVVGTDGNGLATDCTIKLVVEDGSGDIVEADMVLLGTQSVDLTVVAKDAHSTTGEILTSYTMDYSIKVSETDEEPASVPTEDIFDVSAYV